MLMIDPITAFWEVFGSDSRNHENPRPARRPELGIHRAVLSNHQRNGPGAPRRAAFRPAHPVPRGFPCHRAVTTGRRLGRSWSSVATLRDAKMPRYDPGLPHRAWLELFGWREGRTRSNSHFGDFTGFGLRGSVLEAVRLGRDRRGFKSNGYDPTRFEAAQHERY